MQLLFNSSKFSCAAILMKTILHLQFATQIFFHVELNLSIECLPLIVVFEILAHGVTQKNSYCEFLRSKILDLHVVLGRVSRPMN